MTLVAPSPVLKRLTVMTAEEVGLVSRDTSGCRAMTTALPATTAGARGAVHCIKMLYRQCTCMLNAVAGFAHPGPPRGAAWRRAPPAP